MNKFILLFFSLINIQILFSQINTNIISYYDDPYKYPVDMQIDIDKIYTEIKIEPKKQIVDGIAKYTFRTLRKKIDTLIFTTPDINFIKVEINNIELKFQKNDNLTFIFTDNIYLDYLKDYELKIQYQANPKRELYFSGWNDPTNRKRKQIWAHSPSNWLPFINQKHDILKTEFKITFDEKYKVFSNGDRISVVDNNDGTKTWHYRLDKPHVIYLICLVIGDYDFITTKSGNTPIELWYYPEYKDRVNTTYKYMEEMIPFIENETGIKYPWSLYRQAPVVDYLYAGMETTTSTVFGDFLFIDERAWWMRNYVNVNVHELIHQWFGNLVSHLNNPNVWLTETFATYFAKIFEKHIFGEDYYQWERLKELERTLDAAKKDSRPIANSMAGSIRWYPKGSLVMDMLRDIMGDAEFKTAIKYYTEQNYHKVTSTPDFVRAIRESTGYSLDWFFEQWIYRGGEPSFKVNYEIASINDKNYVLMNIEQIHKVDELIKYFKVPITIDIYFTDNSIKSYTNWVDGQSTLFKVEIPNNKKVNFIVFDPNKKIIKTLKFQRNLNEIFEQALKAKNMIDRYDALVELREVSLDQKREILHKAFKNETFHLTKSEIIKQLSNDNKSFNIIIEAINSNDQLVVRSVVENITTVPNELENEYKKILKDSCYINVEKALQNLTLSFPDNDYLSLTKDEIGWRGKNIRITWLKLSLFKKYDEKLLNELIDYTSQSFDDEVRVNAMNALKSLNIFNEQICDNVIDAYNYWSNKTKPAALNILSYFYEQLKYKNIIDRKANFILLSLIKK